MTRPDPQPVDIPVDNLPPHVLRALKRARDLGLDIPAEEILRHPSMVDPPLTPRPFTLPQSPPLPAFDEIPPSFRTLRNLANRNRVIE